MITYIDSENKQNYTVLFEKASTKLGLKPIIEETRDPETLETIKKYYKRTYDQDRKDWIVVECGENEVDKNTDTLLDAAGNPIQPISSLNEYFQHIRDLAGMAIGQGRSGSDPYFLRLPLDEPFFEINANTRGITVPGELSQIAVRGDKLAEVVFFRIDRYYDAVDLNTRHIYIEWEAPDGNGGVKKGISRDFLRDTQSEKDKIIFGWAIGDELTQNVGTIRFAVRFVEWFDNSVVDQDDRRVALDTATTDTQLLYSFSSLPATVSVVDSLNYSLFEDDEAFQQYYNTALTEENIGTMVLYLEDSDADVTGETAAEDAYKPYFVLDLTDAYYVDAVPNPGHEGEYRINLIGEYGTATRELRVEANSDDGGQISYVFGRIAHTKDEGTGIAATGSKGIVAKIKYIPATGIFDDDDNFNEKKTFYLLNGTGAYVAVNETEMRAARDALGEDEELQAFERVAWVEVNQPGHYYAIADNRVGGKKANSEYSKRFYIPWAAVPTATTKMLDEEGKPQQFVIKKVEYTKSIDNTVIQTGDNPQSNINYTTGEEGAAYVELHPVVVTSDSANTDNLTYQWYKHTDNHVVNSAGFSLDMFNRPDGLKDDEWMRTEPDLLDSANWKPIEGAVYPTYIAGAPGCYALKVINAFNNDRRETNFFEAGVCRVTNMPKEVAITNWDEIRNYPSVAGTVTIPNVQIAVDDCDEVTYEWHMITPNNEDEDLVATTYMAEATGTVDMTFNAETQKYEGSILVRPLDAGFFYLVIKNTLNGAESYINTAKSYGKIWVSSAR